jgi:hypothetical protein
MNVVLPMVAMALFSVLFVGAYGWMRRAEFGESEKPKMRISSEPIKALSNPKDDHRGVEQSLRNARDASESTQDQMEMLKRVGL